MAGADGPFVPGGEVRIDGRAGGPLDGLTFAAKDLFDVAGLPTGGGNPDWPGADAPADRHAWAVETLLEAGAALIGKTITDEVSLGIFGESAFYGTPVNPAAPDRVPGGSSSGSASAVASGLCDTALGSDTGGSVRVPSSFCGLYGIRPTWGRLDLRGMMPQAPSSDTTGWFARDAETFARVSAVLLQEAIPEALPSRLLVAVDAFGFADGEVAEALRPAVERLGRIVGASEEVTMAPPGLSAWARAQRTAPALGSLAHLPGLARPAQSAHGVFGRAQSRPGRRHRRSGPALGVDAARGGAGPAHPPAAAGHSALPADHALPRAAEGPFDFGTGGAEDPHLRAREPWRPHRRAAGQPAGRGGGRPAGRAFHPRRPRNRCQPRRAGAGNGANAMTDMTPNIPEAVAEVRARFEAYEAALETKDVDVLDATFWDSPHTIRYALHENGYGFAEIHAHRVARPPGPGIKEERRRLEILTLGRDYAVVNLEFKVRGRDLIGRQSQTWARFPDLGWKVVAAHVSTVSETPFW